MTSLTLTPIIASKFFPKSYALTILTLRHSKVHVDLPSIKRIWNDNMISDFQFINSTANGFDNTSSFMAEQQAPPQPPLPLELYLA